MRPGGARPKRADARPEKPTMSTSTIVYRVHTTPHRHSAEATHVGEYTDFDAACAAARAAVDGVKVETAGESWLVRGSGSRRAEIVECLVDSGGEAEAESDAEGEPEAWPDGWSVEHDASGRGHSWRAAERQNLPPTIVEEIMTSILEGEPSDGSTLSNGLHYRWRRDDAEDTTEVRGRPE